MTRFGVATLTSLCLWLSIPEVLFSKDMPSSAPNDSTNIASDYCHRLVNNTETSKSATAKSFSDIEITTEDKKKIAAVFLKAFQAGNSMSKEQREKIFALLTKQIDDSATNGQTDISKQKLFDICIKLLSHLSTLLP